MKQLESSLLLNTVQGLSDKMDSLHNEVTALQVSVAKLETKTSVLRIFVSALAGGAPAAAAAIYFLLGT